MLRTRKYRAKYRVIDTVWGVCGEEKETAECLILYCKVPHPAVARGDTDLLQALGFKDNDGKIDAGKAATTKRRFSDWWHKSRN